MKLRKIHIFSAAMVLTMVASFAGAISGTVAWYASSTRVTASYEGTSVAQSEQLQIGLQSDINFTAGIKDLDGHDIDLGLVKETIGGKDYYWAKAGSGFNSLAIESYLKHQGYATTELSPVTSRTYATGDDLDLKKAPMAYSNQFHPASTSAYCKINFAFRVIHTGVTGEDMYAKNENVWITDAVATTAGDETHQIFRALRLHFNDGNSKFVLNPGIGKEAPAGNTPVAGLLDLNNDGFYDLDETEELVYGTYTKTVAHPDNNPANHLTDFATDTALEDVNGYIVSDAKPRSTFYAAHRGGTTGYTKEQFASYIAPSYAHYESLSSVAPNDNGAGYLTGGTPVCVTSNDENALAETTMTIYLEGWDHSVIDAEISHRFHLGLQFQINRAA